MFFHLDLYNDNILCLQGGSMVKIMTPMGLRDKSTKSKVLRQDMNWCGCYRRQSLTGIPLPSTVYELGPYKYRQPN